MSEDAPQNPPPEGEQQAQQPQDGPNPTPAELALAESMMNPAQRAATEIREQNTEELAKIPEDLDYKVDGHTWPTHMQRDHISGTFDGKQTDVRLNSDSPRSNKNYEGSVDGTKMTPEEAKETWNKLSSMVELLRSYEESQHEARKQVEEDTRTEAKRREIAELQGVAETQNEAFNRFRAALDRNLEKMAVGEDSPDYEFLTKSVTKVAMLAALRPSEGPHSADIILRERPSRNFDDKSFEAVKEYKRKKDLLFQLLGVNEEAGQTWEAGFGNNYVDSKVYPTSLEGINLRDRYGNGQYNEDHELSLESQNTSAVADNPGIKQAA